MQTTQAVPTATPVKNRTTGWLLIASLPLFAIWFAVAMSMLASTGVSNSADLTPDQLSSIRLGWVVIWPLYGVALLVGLAGATRLNRTLSNLWATVGQVANALAALAITACVLIMLAMTGSTEPRLGDHPWWDRSMLLSVVAVVLALAGTVLTGVALRTTGYLRRTGLWVAITGGVLLVLNLVTAGNLPPFLPAVLWLVIGIALLRRPVASRS